MTVYARNDVASVSISSDSGGCGSTHSRPAPGGKSVDLWSLTCNRGCEDVLRKDPLWSATVSEVPETYDERIVREDAEKRGKLDAEKRALNVQNDTAEALKALTELLGKQNSGTDVAAITAAVLAALKQAEKPSEPEDTPTLDDLSFADLKKLAAQRGIRVTRSRDDQIAALREHLGG